MVILALPEMVILARDQSFWPEMVILAGDVQLLRKEAKVTVIGITGHFGWRSISIRKTKYWNVLFIDIITIPPPDPVCSLIIYNLSLNVNEVNCNHSISKFRC